MLERTRRGRSSIQVIVKDMAALMFFIRKQPRTVRELEELTGQTEDKVIRTLSALVEEGLIERSDQRERAFAPESRPAYSHGNARARHTFHWVEFSAEDGQC